MNNSFPWPNEIAQRLSTLNAVAFENGDIFGALVASKEAIIGVDCDARIVLFNAAAEELTGWEQSEILGETWYKLQAGEDVQTIPSRESSIPSLGRFADLLPINMEMSLLTSEGSSLRTAVSCVLLHDVAGDPLSSVFILRDITREAEIERFRTDFLSSVSHELLTPIAALGGCAELLMDNFDSMSRADFLELLQIMRDGSHRLEHMVQNLLDAGQIQSGHFRVYLQPVETATIAGDAIVLVESMLKRKKQQLETSLPQDLGLVLADQDRVTQVLLNLLSNASKYGPESAPVHLRVSDGGECIRIEVQDRGRGIPSEDWPYIFQRFYRASVSTGGEASGVGLGLAICKSIVELHSGEIGFDSGPGKGTTIWFTIPKLSVAGGEGREDTSN